MKKLNTENPFVTEIYGIWTGYKTSLYAKGTMVSLVDDRTGEVKGQGFNAVVKERQYDKERFVKMYKKGREILPKLSIAGVRMLWFLLDGMGYDDVVMLNMSKAKKETNYKSEATIYRAIMELKKHNVIANAYRNGLYYVNPTMFYRGDRLKLIKS